MLAFHMYYNRTIEERSSALYPSTNQHHAISRNRLPNDENDKNAYLHVDTRTLKTPYKCTFVPTLKC